MVEWFRAETDIRSDPRFGELGRSLRLPRDFARSSAVGLVLCLMANVADHEPSGILADVSDGDLEDWAGWRGEEGLFASEFRRLFVTDGHLDGWADRQGKLIAMQAAKREADRARKAWKSRGNPASVAATSALPPREVAVESSTHTYTNSNSSSSPTPPAREAVADPPLDGSRLDVENLLESAMLRGQPLGEAWNDSARRRLVRTLPPERQSNLVARMSGWLEGMGLAPGLRATVADVEMACGDLLDTAPSSPPSPSTVRGFVEKCIRRRLADEAGGALAGPARSRPTPSLETAGQMLWDAVTAAIRSTPWRMIPRDRFTLAEWRVIGQVGGLGAIAEMSASDLPHVQRRFIAAYADTARASGALPVREPDRVEASA